MNSSALANEGKIGGSTKCTGIHEMKTELSILLESLKYHMNSPDAQRTSLASLSTMLLHSDEAKEMFRKCGGLLFVRTLLTSVENEQVKIAALYTLGCALEKSMLSQKHLCEASIFQFLHSQLISESSSNNLKILSTFLILCLVTNNGEGQMMVRDSKCLHVLLSLFRNNNLRKSLLHPEKDNLLDNIKEDEENYKLWMSVTRCLCGCTNNPQNDENQLLCASVYSAALNIIEKTSNQDVIRLVLSFISLTVANNEKNQNRIGMLGGLKVFVCVFRNQLNMLETHTTVEAMQMLEHTASTIVSCIEDNEDNQLLLADLHIIHLFLQALCVECMSTSTKLQLVITLVLCTESCEETQKQFIVNGGVTLLVQLMSQIQDEEFSKTATYLLQTCLASQKSTGIEAFRMMPELTSKSREVLQHYRNQKYTPITAYNKGKHTQNEEPQVSGTSNMANKGITQNLQSMMQMMMKMFEKTINNQQSTNTAKTVNATQMEITENDEDMLTGLAKTPAFDLHNLDERLKNLEKSIQRDIHHGSYFGEYRPASNNDEPDTIYQQQDLNEYVDTNEHPLVSGENRQVQNEHKPDTSNRPAHHDSDQTKLVSGSSTIGEYAQVIQTEKQPKICREIATQTPTKSCSGNTRYVKKCSTNQKKNNLEKRSNVNSVLSVRHAISSHVYAKSGTSDDDDNVTKKMCSFKKPEVPTRHKKQKTATASRKSLKTLYNRNKHFLVSHDESDAVDFDNEPPAYNGYDDYNDSYDYNDSDMESVISELSLVPSVMEGFLEMHMHLEGKDSLKNSTKLAKRINKEPDESNSTSPKRICHTHLKKKQDPKHTDNSDVNTSFSESADVYKSKKNLSSKDNLPEIKRKSAKRSYQVKFGKDIGSCERLKIKKTSHSASSHQSFRNFATHQNKDGEKQLKVKRIPHSAYSHQPFRNFATHQIKDQPIEASDIAKLYKQCPGCVPPVDLPLLNSINYEPVLNSCKHTCEKHQYIITVIEKYRQKIRKCDECKEKQQEQDEGINQIVGEITNKRNQEKIHERCEDADEQTMDKGTECMEEQIANGILQINIHERTDHIEEQTANIKQPRNTDGRTEHLKNQTAYKKQPRNIDETTEHIEKTVNKKQQRNTDESTEHMADQTAYKSQQRQIHRNTGQMKVQTIEEMCQRNTNERMKHREVQGQEKQKNIKGRKEHTKGKTTTKLKPENLYNGTATHKQQKDFIANRGLRDERVLFSRSGNVIKDPMANVTPYNFRKRSKRDYAEVGLDSNTKREPSTKRRQRKNFTDEEVYNLINGVKKKGKNWNSILWSYDFQPCRTNVDLKDKYRNLEKKGLC